MLTDHLAPLLLVLVVLGTECNVVHAARTKTTMSGLGVDHNVNMIAESVAGGRKPQAVCLLRHLAESKQSERCFGPACVSLEHCHSEEAADRMLNRHVGKTRRLQRSKLGMAYKLNPHAVGIAECQDGFSHAFFFAFQRDILRREPFLPIGNRGRRNTECRVGDFPCPDRPAGRMRPREEREDGAGGSGIIAEVEVVSPRIIEVYRLLDEAETKHLGIEIQIPLWVAGYSSHMVQSY